eukprot:4652889-Pleurochrysis_carterae.AAC.1
MVLQMQHLEYDSDDSHVIWVGNSTNTLFPQARANTILRPTRNRQVPVPQVTAETAQGPERKACPPTNTKM